MKRDEAIPKNFIVKLHKYRATMNPHKKVFHQQRYDYNRCTKLLKSSNRAENEYNVCLTCDIMMNLE